MPRSPNGGPHDSTPRYVNFVFRGYPVVLLFTNETLKNLQIF